VLCYAERDNAIAAAEKAQEKIKNMIAQLNEQVESVGMLQNEIKEFELVIENQEKTIAEQQVADDWSQSYLLSIFLLQKTFLMARYSLVTDLMDLS
jgi:hypothetical protein